MSYVMVDVETDGPIPADYSMICFGAVIVDESLDKRFYGQLRPISEQWIPESLKISGFSREETLGFDDPRADCKSIDGITTVSKPTLNVLRRNGKQSMFEGFDQLWKRSGLEAAQDGLDLRPSQFNGVEVR